MGLLDYVFFAPFRCEGTERCSTMGLVEQSGEQHQLWVHPPDFRQLMSESCVLCVSLKVSVTRKPWAYGRAVTHFAKCYSSWKIRDTETVKPFQKFGTASFPVLQCKSIRNLRDFTQGL